VIILTVGIPASGKSTWAKQYVRDNADCVRICRDDFRAMLKDSTMLDRDGENFVSTLVESSIRQAVQNGLNVVVDQTNCNVRFLKKLVEFCRNLSDVKFAVFPIPLEEAVKRNKGRKNPVPEDVIRKMADGWHSVADLGFQDIKKQVVEPYVAPANLPPAILCDLDGTLAHMIDRGPFDWAKVGQDALNESVRQALFAYGNNGVTVILLSGRDSICRRQTEEWLRDNDVPYCDLHMRTAGDCSPDTVVKRQIFDDHIRDKYDVIGVFDDRKSVKRMWVQLGLHVFDCNQHDLEF
jgi:predicted kinase